VVGREIDCGAPQLDAVLGDVYKRMEDRSFTELDLRAMLEAASGYRKDVARGRWVIEAKRGRQRWEVIVEPDDALNMLVVTAYQV
jgi:hypothetical protein